MIIKELRDFLNNFLNKRLVVAQFKESIEMLERKFKKNNYKNTPNTIIEERLVQFEEQIENLTTKIISLEDKTSETSSEIGDIEGKINSFEERINEIIKFITESLPNGLGKRFVE